jgi:hypothetical protein
VRPAHIKRHVSAELAESLATADLLGDFFLEWAASQTLRTVTFLSWCQGHKNIKVRDEIN